jgi:sugar O-acyltransferase (sialic acid O-acetyltransferase NeuD family)
MQKVVILGTGGNCLDILDAIIQVNARSAKPRYQCVGFLDDDTATHARAIHGVSVLGALTMAATLQDDVRFVNGIGSPRNFWRKDEIIARTGVAEDRYVTIVHPSAQVSAFAKIGAGTVLLQNAVVASNALVGKHVMVLPCSVVSHDCRIGEYTTIAGGVCISANVITGRACYIGAGALIRGDVTLGDGVLCGMGSNVLNDVPSNSVVVGNPARRLRDVQGSAEH